MTQDIMINVGLRFVLYGLCFLGIFEVLKLFKFVINPPKPTKHWYDDVHTMD